MCQVNVFLGVCYFLFFDSHLVLLSSILQLCFLKYFVFNYVFIHLCYFYICKV